MVMLAQAGAFAVCIGAGFAMGEALTDRSTTAFFISICVALGLGGAFHLLGRRGSSRLFRREALCAIGISWILSTLVGAIPYMIAWEAAFSDAVFESASGLTTTGATAFSDFAEFPSSLLFWRSLSQWMGGLGVVVLFVAILSSLGAGAKILFSNESSGTSNDFDQGRIQRGAFDLMIFYISLSSLCAIAYKLAGMNWFQAINHGMTTVATGGFSTEAASIEQFASPAIEWIAIAFMAISGTTFIYLIRLFRGRFYILRQNHEVYWYYGLLAVSTLLLTLYLYELTGKIPDHNSIRAALFQATSIMTTTGYSSTDFDQWLAPAKMLLVILMFIGGCSGSTAGGSKVIRLVIALRAAIRSISHSFRPNITIPMRMSGRTLTESAIHSVMLFLMLMTGLQIVSMLVVSIVEPNLNFLEIFSSVQATLFNIGPGFGALGPTQNFQFLQPVTKLYLSLLMVLGRLELYAVLVLLAPSVWRRFS